MIEVEKITKPNRTFYYIKGTDICHRDDGPALITWDGSEMWYINNKLHRIDGPAVEWSNGNLERWFDGKCHREDGPALIYSDGYIMWCLNGKHFPAKESWFEALTESQKEKALYSEYFMRG